MQPPGIIRSNKTATIDIGEVDDIGTLSDGSITVKFKERRDAESAKMKGAFYNSGVLLMDWLEAGENRDA